MHPRTLLKGAHAYLTPTAALEAVDGELSGARPSGAPHAIVEIVAHMAFWQDWFLDRADGIGTLAPASAGLGWPTATAADWPRVAGRFQAGFARALALAADEPRLAQPVTPALEFEPLSGYSIADALTHIALHNAHHVGQIITLRQQLGAWPPPSGGWTW
jgi:uncharacterized damage-inducible protein DinB